MTLASRVASSPDKEDPAVKVTRSPRGLRKTAAALTSIGPTVFAAALLALGIRSMLSGTFIPAWQPVPKTLPDRELWAVASGAVLTTLALMTFTKRLRTVGGIGLSLLLTAWLVVLQAPVIVAAPGAVVTWLGVAEVGALAAAAVITAEGGRRGGRVGGPRKTKAARITFGLCAVIFGISHFAYADFTAGMVPNWLPARTFLACATGAAHMAAGVAIATGLVGRLAATLLTLMTACFVLLVHVPAVVASGASMAQVTFLLTACAICGAAWTMIDPRAEVWPRPTDYRVRG